MVIIYWPYKKWIHKMELA